MEKKHAEHHGLVVQI